MADWSKDFLLRMKAVLAICRVVLHFASLLRNSSFIVSLSTDKKECPIPSPVSSDEFTPLSRVSVCVRVSMSTSHHYLFSYRKRATKKLDKKAEGSNYLMRYDSVGIIREAQMVMSQMGHHPGAFPRAGSSHLLFRMEGGQSQRRRKEIKT